MATNPPILGAAPTLDDSESKDPCLVRPDAKHCPHPLGPTILAQPADGSEPYLFEPLLCCWCKSIRLIIQVAGLPPRGHGPYVEYRPMTPAQRIQVVGPGAPLPRDLHV